MPNWIWPRSAVTVPTGVGRLGRVLHWIFALFAVVAFLGGATATAYTYRNHNQSLKEIAAWDKDTKERSAKAKAGKNLWDQFPLVRTYTVKMPDGRIYQIEGPEGATQEQLQAEVLLQQADPYAEFADAVDPKTWGTDPAAAEKEVQLEQPYEVDANPLLALFGTVAAFALLLFGRGVRYILSAE